MRKNVFPQRVDRVREVMKEHEVDGLVLTNFEEGRANIRYLTGFTGSLAACFITRDTQVFVTDIRYALQASDEVRKKDERWCFEIERDHLGSIANLAESSGVKRLGLIREEESWDTALTLKKKLESCELVALLNIVGEARAVKDEGEIKNIRRAVRETEIALKHVFAQVKPGISDRELATEFKVALMRRGLDVSFPPIVVSGAHSAIIHGNPFELPYKEVEHGDIIQFDVGCMFKGYASDISRVVVCGTASDKQKKMHSSVTRAVREAKRFYKPGTRFWDVNKKAKEIIKGEGFSPFEHGLGHGLGMDVHEPHPPLILQDGNVVTLEPGIYIKNYGGMRIERDVLVTSDGPKMLDILSSRLLEL